VAVSSGVVAVFPKDIDPLGMAALGLASVTAFEALRRIGDLKGRRIVDASKTVVSQDVAAGALAPETVDGVLDTVAGKSLALHVLAYNLTRVMNIMGIRPLMAAMRA
jgi:hypothetical protein